MRLVNQRSKRWPLGLCLLWLSLAGRPAAPDPALSITPADPTISAGQTLQFTASGALAPTGVSAGGEYTCVRLPDGTAQCVGRNQFGQHGNGTENDSSVLDPVNSISTATRVSAGDEYACALLGDGTARCWGLGESGQRGDGSFGTFTPGDVPVAVSGLTGAVALATGYGHTCALLGDATMRCWGGNREGELGNGTTADPGTAQPVAVSHLTGATAFTTGAYHTCAILADSTVRCWGRNGQGQLGDGTVTNSSTPVQVQTGFGPLSGVTALAGGGAHTCALLANRTVRCWGENSEGQLGDGTTFGKPNGIAVTGISTAVAISAGWEHTCAVLADGTVRCWGANASGQLGDGTTTRRTTPVSVSGLSGAAGVTAGWWHHSCALLGDGTVRCWGENPWGQLGNGTTTSSLSPVTMSGTGVTWTSSNTAVATIDGTGRATGVGAGVTTITATDATGASASTTLTVVGEANLTVFRTGAGTGTVTSSPAGINCGSDCSEAYASGTVVTLTASAASNSTFAGWSGCDTVSGATCTVTVDSGRTATAAFDLKRFVLTVNKTGLVSGQGSVTSNPPGIDCGADCAETYTSGTVVTLTASPSMLFGSWSGCDSVSGATCTVTVTSARSVTAGFVP
jgi:alpha-tubulin suppressor-like RCC1 family protein